jgi:hypothetical protein
MVADVRMPLVNRTVSVVQAIVVDAVNFVTARPTTSIFIITLDGNHTKQHQPQRCVALKLISSK